MRHPPNFDFSVAGQDFKTASRFLIHQFKYRKDSGVLDALMRALVSSIERAYPQRQDDHSKDWPDALIPYVPGRVNLKAGCLPLIAEKA
ncbi:MAG: hypothetical protein B7X28_01650 [Halothiobacillus sp. 13-55-253]|nr:MAG: hypothetical protein B7X28_01650 [Halothiobacillus sp. 13-55-253]